MSDDGDSDVDWMKYAYSEDNKGPAVSLDLTDYAAIFIAALQTIFLPLVILGGFLFSLAIFFSLMW